MGRRALTSGTTLRYDPHVRPSGTEVLESGCFHKRIEKSSQRGMWRPAIRDAPPSPHFYVPPHLVYPLPVGQTHEAAQQLRTEPALGRIWGQVGDPSPPEGKGRGEVLERARFVIPENGKRLRAFQKTDRSS